MADVLACAIAVAPVHADPDPASEQVTQALLGEPLTVEELARHANVSSRHLGRQFRAATGTTALQWLLTQRIRRAQELLETGDDGVDAIARATGMGTATTLRRHFQRAVGVPPAAYRQAFRTRVG